MFKSLQHLFQYYARDVRIDKSFLKDLRDFEINFVNRSEDHIAFFGGNLLGVHPMRFTVNDMNAWFDEIFPVDDLALQDDIYNLPSVERSHRVRSNVFNLSCVYLIHACKTSHYLNEKEKEEGALLVALIFQYKLLGSILARFFPYPADESIATATYRTLSRKFGLKQHGSWKKLLVARGLELISDRSIHAGTFKRFNDDENIQYVCGDAQTRLKKLVKDMNDVFYQVKASEIRSLYSNPLADVDGEKLVKDIQSNESDNIRYIQQVIRDKHGFIKEELFDATLDIMGTTSEKHLRQTLEYLIGNYTGRTQKDIDNLTQELVVYSMNYVSVNRDILPNSHDIMAVVLRLKGVFMASKNTEESVAKIRSLTEKLVKSATGVRNPNTLSSVRTATIIYLLLRTLSRAHYQNLAA